MPIIGTNFFEMSFKRNDMSGEKITPGDMIRNFNVVDIRPKEVPVDTSKSDVLSFKYEYEITYNLNKPKDKEFGKIRIVGEVLYMDSKDAIKKIYDGWKKDRNVDKEVFQQVIINALNVSQIEALYNSSKVLLPPPFPLPNVKVEGKE